MAMNVIVLGPGYPAEIPHFVRGLAAVGARVLGVGDQPAAAIPEPARSTLADYLQVTSLWDEQRVVDAVRRQWGNTSIHRVECLWEPLMMLGARLRAALGVAGMDMEQTLLFRDKERMKLALDAAGVRVPRHTTARTAAQLREAAERLGYPLVVKPIAGAGAADTYRVEDPAGLERVIAATRHVAEVGLEEFIEGEEYTFDTICTGGRIVYYNVSWYRPRLLVARAEAWISPQTVSFRNEQRAEVQAGRVLGEAVIQALGFCTGFTHMEWFLTPAGEAVFVEIAARPPGARTVDLMNYASDVDVYAGWAEAVCQGSFGQAVERRYNAAVVFKRALGPESGHITRIDGLGALMARYGPHVACVDLLPVGARRRDWRRTFVADGHVIVRHPDLQTTLEMADRIGMELQIHAG